MTKRHASSAASDCAGGSRSSDRGRVLASPRRRARSPIKPRRRSFARSEVRKKRASNRAGLGLLLGRGRLTRHEVNDRLVACAVVVSAIDRLMIGQKARLISLARLLAATKYQTKLLCQMQRSRGRKIYPLQRPPPSPGPVSLTIHRHGASVVGLLSQNRSPPK